MTSLARSRSVQPEIRSTATVVSHELSASPNDALRNVVWIPLQGGAMLSLPDNRHQFFPALGLVDQVLISLSHHLLLWWPGSRMAAPRLFHALVRLEK
jgi:hypothetical protein